MTQISAQGQTLCADGSARRWAPSQSRSCRRQRRRRKPRSWWIVVSRWVRARVLPPSRPTRSPAPKNWWCRRDCSTSEGSRAAPRTSPIASSGTRSSICRQHLFSPPFPSLRAVSPPMMPRVAAELERLPRSGAPSPRSAAGRARNQTSRGFRRSKLPTCRREESRRPKPHPTSR